jgi:DNA mismatch endonuclease (patch repair protein)
MVSPDEDTRRSVRRATNADPLDRRARSERMGRIGSKDTRPEMLLRRSLWALGVRYRLHPDGVPGRPDLVVPGARLAVFVDGCFWHGCPRHYTLPRNNRAFWLAKVERNRARRDAVLRELRREGWRVVQAWECDVRLRAPVLAARIARRVRNAKA